MNYEEGVCRTAPAPPGLLISQRPSASAMCRHGGSSQYLHSWVRRLTASKHHHPRVASLVMRGLTEENTQMGIISPIGYFKSLIGNILSNWRLVICSLTLRYQTQNMSPIPNWIKYNNWGYEIPNWRYYAQLGIFYVSSLLVVNSDLNFHFP